MTHQCISKFANCIYHWGRRFVGLELSKEEQEAWDTIQSLMMSAEKDGVSLPAEKNGVETDGSVPNPTSSQPTSPSSVPASITSTGRKKATPTIELKQDVVTIIMSKIKQNLMMQAKNSRLKKDRKKNVKQLSEKRIQRSKHKTEPEGVEKRSFTDLDEDSTDGVEADSTDGKDEDSTDGKKAKPLISYDFFGSDYPDSATTSTSPSLLRRKKMRPTSEQDFLGSDYPDSATTSFLQSTSPSLLRRKKMQPTSEQPSLNNVQFDPVKLYRGVSGWWYKKQNLEGLLYLKRKGVPKKHEDDVRRHEQKIKRRPYFTYWLIFVNVVILLVTLSVYGFAPYGWDIVTKEALVQKTNLALEVAKKNVTGNVWGGPPLDALVRLGAKYAPCMRRDRQLYRAIEGDWVNEANNSGCCVRRDTSGCVQMVSDANCVSSFADFVYVYNETDVANCGVLSAPAVTLADSQTPTGTLPVFLIGRHLTCELTGRPCCVGILAVCLITTREHCDFLGGSFNQSAFLCSQVDCLGAVCGMLPFNQKNQPDQVYRLWLSLFLHAGIFHLILTLLFDILFLRIVEKKIGCFKTMLLYVLSGIGGNIISSVFVPYYPQVGPGSSIFGTIAYIFVFVSMESHILVVVWRHLGVMSAILVTALILGVLLPILDNYAHVGGLVFGLFLSFIFVQHLELKPQLDKKECGCGVKCGKCVKCVKYVMLPVSCVSLILLYTSSLVWFYKGQDNWYGFTYGNCIPYTATFCVDYGQNLERVQIAP